MRRPRVLTIAGSDSGGGAGIQADLKTFCAHGVYGMTAITAITAQNTLGVDSVFAVPAVEVGAQIDAVLGDLGVDAIKIGMLGNREIVEVVSEKLEAIPGIPIVLDPVMVAESGARLISQGAIAVLRERLLPRATIVTPNLPEAGALTGRSMAEASERKAAAQELFRRGQVAVLIKDGHGSGSQVEDLLFDGRRFRSFFHPRLSTKATHGTGCTLSSAIAARLARGVELETAVERSIDYLQQAMRNAWTLGAGKGPVDHLHGTRSVR